MSMLAIGVTGLNAAQLGLITTEHNVANANTEGYNRQRTTQAANTPMTTGSGFLGQGVNVQTVQRFYNGFVAGQVATSATRTSELETYLDQVTLIDNMLADPSAGLSPALQDFFRGVQQVAADPASLPARQAMVSATESLVARFQSIEQRLAEQYDSVNEQLTSHVDLVNSLATQIAEMNQRIVVSQAGTGQPANDLLDQRDNLIAQLNDEIRVTTVPQTDGTLNVFIGNGQQMVIGVQANRLAALPSLNDPERFAISIVGGPTPQELPESVLQGGALGGLLRFRAESLDAAANSLGRIASSMALTFNAQHALGQDLLGNISGDPAFAGNFFQLSAPKVVTSLLNTGAPDITAAFIEPPPLRFNNGDFSVTFSAAGYEVVSQKYGIAAGTIVQPTLELALQAADALPGVPAIDPASGSFFTNLTTSDYRVQFDATGANFTVTRLSDQAVMGAGTVGGPALLFDGLSLAVPTTAAGPNDTFTLQPNRETARNLQLNTAIAADPRLIAAAGPVRAETAAVNTGSGKIEVVAVAPGYVAPPTGAPLQISFSSTPVPNQLTINGSVSANITITSGTTTVAATAGVAFTYGPDAIITVDGLSFRISGAPKQGDSFTVQRNTNGVSDSRNALALGQLQTQETMAGGKTSFQGGYAQLVSEVGNKTREIQVTGEAQKSLLDQAIAAREAQSGVNLDEEAANLIRYQQAYQAAARVIDVGSRLFDVILTMGR
ncbi:MAG TPA: flagellar hook-associated protein FlgK [Rhodocyclaceae bacterium]|nr:flagellar hook-associated protein FlgK [Rhodocyclaceae bacterium]